MQLTHYQRALIREALGLPAPGDTTTRNRIAIAPDAPALLAAWQGLVARGAAEAVDADGAQAAVFRASRAGALAALHGREQLCPLDFPPDQAARAEGIAALARAG